MRQFTRKGDPMLRIKLSKVIRDAIVSEAKKYRRPPQDELIKCIVNTFKNPDAFEAIQKEFLPSLNEVYQSKPSTNGEPRCKN